MRGGLFDGYHTEVNQANDHVDHAQRRLLAQRAVVQGVQNKARENRAERRQAIAALETRKKLVNHGTEADEKDA